MKVLQIGCGGIGGWLAFFFAKTLTSVDSLTLCDGDTVEEHNLDRQFFDEVGGKKAELLTKRLGYTKCRVESMPEYFDPGCVDAYDVLAVAVDNHKCRSLALRSGLPVIIGANEYATSEGYIYLPEWVRDPNLDPRAYYPAILTDLTGDPTSPSCTGEAVEHHPQLPMANMQAATFMATLFTNWIMNTPNGYTPYRYYTNGKIVTAYRRENQ